MSAPSRRRRGYRRRRAARVRQLAGVPVRLALRSVLALLLVGACGCALHDTWMPPGAAPVEPAAAVDCTLFLVGDAGEPNLATPEPVLEALGREAAQDPERSLVIFLGDNVYPDGLAAATAADRARGEAILRRQAGVVQKSGAHGIFLPGNHDYHLDGRDGVRRQAEFIASLAVPRLEFRPRETCAGPESVDFGATLRLIVFDSTWWIRDEFSPPDDADCAVRSEAAFLARLDSLLASAAPRTVIVATHHPVASHGWHGGFFTWRDHLFPLTRAYDWLWLPLPAIGSLYPIYRMAGGYRQDIPASRYQHMLSQLHSVFARHPPLALAAGHDHNLQVLNGRHGVRYALVSGAGSVSRPDPVSHGDDTLCASPAAGFLRLDLLPDGGARLEVVEVGADGRATRPWSALLVTTP